MGNYTTKRTDKDVLSALAQFTERGNGVAVREIAAHLDCSERTVRYSIRRLEKAGRVKVMEEKSKPNRYRILQ
jgi:Mn-dependent DtxR family transcriptional regulator